MDEFWGRKSEGAHGCTTPPGHRSQADLFRLPRLIPATDAELADGSSVGRQRLLARLQRAIRAERKRGRAGHWSYDLNRHIALKQAIDRLSLPARDGNADAHRHSGTN